MMKDQNLWDGFKVHNMQWAAEKAEDTNKVTPIASDFDVRETFLSALDKAKADVKVVEPKPETKPEMPAPTIERKPIVQPDLQREEAAPQSGIEKVFIHCLPAYLRERRDALYGDSYKTIQYGRPTSFEGVILQQTDLAIEVWTDTDKISVGSVLYPKTNFKRWWRVQEKTQKGGGWVLVAMPSDHQPSFDL